VVLPERVSGTTLTSVELLVTEFSAVIHIAWILDGIDDEGSGFTRRRSPPLACPSACSCDRLIA